MFLYGINTWIDLKIKLCVYICMQNKIQLPSVFLYTFLLCGIRFSCLCTIGGLLAFFFLLSSGNASEFEKKIICHLKVGNSFYNSFVQLMNYYYLDQSGFWVDFQCQLCFLVVSAVVVVVLQ